MFTESRVGRLVQHEILCLHHYQNRQEWEEKKSQDQGHDQGQVVGHLSSGDVVLDDDWNQRCFPCAIECCSGELEINVCT